MWTYGHEAVISCHVGHYTGAFDAQSSGIQYGPGGTSTMSGALSELPSDSPFLPNSFAVSGGFSSQSL